tara:strand:- start:1219 stop:2157 length:939 start_codon:yes stop_codon:yes gene_type:complete
MKKIKILLVFLIFFMGSISAKEIKILYKISDNIITSYDVKKETDYLVSLNPNFANYDKDKLRNTAIESLIREKIKKIEIDKSYTIDYELASETELIRNFLKNFWINLGFNDETEFNEYLKSKNIILKDIKKKFVIEQYWNQLIFDNFNNNIKVDIKKIKSIVNDIENNNLEIKSYNLSEIIFSGKDKLEIDRKFKEIINSIEKIGFKDTALLHSISRSAKFGGEIGWISQNQISKKIFEKIRNLEIGQYSEAINTAGGTIILFLNDKKSETSKINKEEEIKKMISLEKNRQLNEFSIMHYKKIENKSYVEKL